jgi:16S rRNA (guanine1207-N2)-methyltransferase
MSARDTDSGHYFDSEPGVLSRPRTVQLDLPDLRAELGSDSGVFSADAVDPGTVELLRLGARRTIPVPPAGDLLDLGCGYGPIACTLAHRHPDRTVWAVDINRRALELTSANAFRLGLPRVRPRRPEEVPAGVELAAIWSNPPIRIGKEALHSALALWLARLTPEGSAYLVVHRHLGADSLAAWLSGQGWTVSRLASKRGYRILAVGSR